METSQLIILIILIVIGIILFVVLLVELVNVPAPLTVPFADGSIVRIKSLANNLYLRPVSCSDVSGCNNDNVRAHCDLEHGTNIVAAIGQAVDPLTRWQLCQYSSLSDTGNAKYIVYSESDQSLSALSAFTTQESFGPLVAPLFVDPVVGGICTQVKTQSLNCNPTALRQHFSFILNERATGNNTTSGSYNIISSCELEAANGFLFSNGIGSTVLPDPVGVCPPLILTQDSGGDPVNCPEPNVDARCSLNYLFEIEVVG